MKKYLELSMPSSTLNKVEPNEPIFIIRASDVLGPATVMDWVQRASYSGVKKEKLEGARHIANEMREWQETHPPKIPD